VSNYSNPVMRGMYPDPSICLVDGIYYLTHSTFEYLPGLPIHSSTDLVNWHLVGHAVHDPSQFDYAAVGDSRGMFAPTIRFHDGLFYIACTQMDAGEQSGSFYVTATDPAGPWSAPVMLPDAIGIDPSIFFHDGRAWWMGCREVAEQTFPGETEVWLRELDLEAGALVGDETVIWTRTQYRAVWAEAPHIYFRNGWFYLVTAEGGTSFEHSVMVARSREVVGPYLPNPRNPVLTHRHLGHGVEVQMVGHADLVETTDGAWALVVLATRPIDGHHILGRETHVADVTWEDDWPVVNPGVGLLEAPVARAGSWGSDEAPSASDFLTVRGFADFVEPRDDGLLLRSVGDALGSERHTAALLRRLTSTESAVSITLAYVDPGAVAGLVLRQSDAFHVRLELCPTDDGQRAHLIVRAGEETSLGELDLPLVPVTLEARVTGSGVSWWAGVADGTPTEVGRTPLGVLSTETAGGFVGTTFGPYVAGEVGAATLFSSWSQVDSA